MNDLNSQIDHIQKNIELWYKIGEEKILKRAQWSEVYGIKARFDTNINLYIDLCRTCSANCEFCIAKLQKRYIKPQVSDEFFCRTLSLVLRELKEKIDPTIMVVGGEPTEKVPRLRKVIELIKKYKIRKPILVTNGSGLHNFFAEIKEGVFEHINISRYHHDNITNKTIFRSQKVPNKEELKRVIQGIKDYTQTRFNTLLTREGLKTYEDVMSFIEFTKEMGVKNISFAELSQLGEAEGYSERIIQYTKDYTVELIPIINRIIQNKDFERVTKVNGPYYQAVIYRHRHTDIVCVFKIQEMERMEKFERKNKNLIAELVFGTDANLYPSWNPVVGKMPLKIPGSTFDDILSERR